MIKLGGIYLATHLMNIIKWCLMCKLDGVYNVEMTDPNHHITYRCFATLTHIKPCPRFNWPELVQVKWNNLSPA